MRDYNIDIDADEAAPVRNGNKAPDWGHNYGIRELWSEVAPGLFVGGTADSDHVGNGRDYLDKMHSFAMLEDAEIGVNDFDAVVSMYAWSRPVDWGVEELRWGIMDGPGGIDMEALKDTVVWAHKHWKVQGKRTLVRCQAGLNRSSLVAALALVRDGVEPSAAIKQIRAARSKKCLFNESFVRLILSTPPEFWRS